MSTPTNAAAPGSPARISTSGTAPRRAAPAAGAAAIPSVGPVVGTVILPADGGARGREEPRHRGSLTLAERVVEKIAAQAATEVAAASGRSGGVFGIRSDADASARPKVDVDLSAESADLDVAVGIAYPGSIRRAAQEIREHVTERVETLTGVDVRRVDIDVTFLTSAPTNPRKRALR